MSLTSRLLTSVALALFFSANAMATDYDPPIYIEEAPEFVPVEVGSGWYLRGDLSYDFADPVYEFDAFAVDNDHNRFGGSIGFGYHFNDNFRTDVTIGYLGRDGFTYDDGVDAVSAKQTSWNGMVNGYFDIATIMGLTPYVGAGVGLTYSRHSATIDSPTLGVAGSYSERQYDFAYALMAGASYKLTENASIDLGYQFLHTPDMEYFNAATLSVDEGHKQHLFKVGLRYDLW